MEKSPGAFVLLRENYFILVYWEVYDTVILTIHTCLLKSTWYNLILKGSKEVFFLFYIYTCTKKVL